MNIKKIFLCIFCLVSFAAFANYADWMSVIPNQRVLNQLIIPGTHDSGTYAIKSESPFALTPDAPLPIWFQAISNLFPISIVRLIVSGWSKTQPESIAIQLNHGIRYFDFRVCLYPDSLFTKHFYLCHTLIGEKLSHALSTIHDFIKAHPTEIVLLDINHIYNLNNSDDEARLVGIIKNKLGDIAISNFYNPDSTVGEIRQSKRNVIILMDVNQKILEPDAAQFAAQYCWPEKNIHSPWPNTSSITDLKNTLDAEIALRAKTVLTSKRFFVLQMIQTENTQQVINGILNSAQYPNTIQRYESPLNQFIIAWLMSYASAYQQPVLNIVMQDWFLKNSGLIDLAIQHDQSCLSEK